jgi:hypothetical protein
MDIFDQGVDAIWTVRWRSNGAGAVRARAVARRGRRRRGYGGAAAANGGATAKSSWGAQIVAENSSGRRRAPCGLNSGLPEWRRRGAAAHGEQSRRCKSGEPGNTQRNAESRAGRTSVFITFTRDSRSASRRRESSDGAESKRRPARVSRGDGLELGARVLETWACTTGSAALIGGGETPSAWAHSLTHARLARGRSSCHGRTPTRGRG